MYDGVRASKVRLCRAVSATCALCRWRLSGKNRKKLLSEESIYGDFIYTTGNKFGFSGWRLCMRLDDYHITYLVIFHLAMPDD